MVFCLVDAGSKRAKEKEHISHYRQSYRDNSYIHIRFVHVDSNVI